MANAKKGEKKPTLAVHWKGAIAGKHRAGMQTLLARLEYFKASVAATA